MASRSARPVRIGLAAIAIGGACGLAITLALANRSGFAGAIGVAGLALLTTGVGRRAPQQIAWGVGMLAVEATLSLRHSTPPAGAAFVGPALLAIAEAGFLCAELHPRLHLEATALAARAWRTATLVAAGLAISAGCLLLGHAGVSASAALSAAGAAAATLLAAAVGLLATARRRAAEEPRPGRHA
jgi:hypothetical protein